MNKILNKVEFVFYLAFWLIWVVGAVVVTIEAAARLNGQPGIVAQILDVAGQVL